MTYAPTILELVLSLIGGGLITALVAERLISRREQSQIVLSHTAELVRHYQMYIRLLKRPLSERSIDELDRVHSAFLAEAKVLGFYAKLSDLSSQLRKEQGIAHRLFDLRDVDAGAASNQEAALNDIYRDFEKITDDILSSAASKSRLRR